MSLSSSLRRLSSSLAPSLCNRLHHYPHQHHQDCYRLINAFPRQHNYPSSSIVLTPTATARTFSSTTPSSTTATTTPSSSSSSSPSGLSENKENAVAGSGSNPSEDFVDTVFGVTLRKADYHPNLIRAISVDNGASRQKRRVQKLSLVRGFRRSESDTGSPEVQIALMTHRINSLSKHMIVHRKDTAKTRDMDVALSQRRRMMKYLFRTSPERYMKVTERLGIRPNSVFADDNRKGARLTPKRNLVHPKTAQPST